MSDRHELDRQLDDVERALIRQQAYAEGRDEGWTARALLAIRQRSEAESRAFVLGWLDGFSTVARRVGKNVEGL